MYGIIHGSAASQAVPGCLCDTYGTEYLLPQGLYPFRRYHDLIPTFGGQAWEGLPFPISSSIQTPGHDDVNVEW